MGNKEFLWNTLLPSFPLQTNYVLILPRKLFRWKTANDEKFRFGEVGTLKQDVLKILYSVTKKRMKIISNCMKPQEKYE